MVGTVPTVPLHHDFVSNSTLLPSQKNNEAGATSLLRVYSTNLFFIIIKQENGVTGWGEDYTQNKFSIYCLAPV